MKTPRHPFNVMIGQIFGKVTVSFCSDSSESIGFPKKLYKINQDNSYTLHGQ